MNLLYFSFKYILTHIIDWEIFVTYFKNNFREIGFFLTTSFSFKKYDLNAKVFIEKILLAMSVV